MIRTAWYAGAPPLGLSVTQVSGFCFASDGCVLLIEQEGTYSLPGGKPEGTETWQETLVREVWEEAQTVLADIYLLGWRRVEHDPMWFSGHPYGQVRMVARIQHIGASMPDPASGKTYRRVLCPPDTLLARLGWPDGRPQIRAALARATQLWALPPAPPR